MRFSLLVIWIIESKYKVYIENKKQKQKNYQIFHELIDILGRLEQVVNTQKLPT